MSISISNNVAKKRKKNMQGASLNARKKQSKSVMTWFSHALKTVIGVLGIGMLVFLADNVRHLYEDISRQKIEHVTIEGSLDYMSKSDMENIVSNFMNQALMSLDLRKIKREIEYNPWINTAEVRRKWPDTLVIRVEEEVAIARWGEGGLLSQEGKIFFPAGPVNLSELPFLSGPGMEEKIVMEQYQKMNQMLYPEGLRIISLELSDRHAWTLGLDNGVEVKVGANNVLERVRRLVGVVDYLLIEDMSNIKSIDLRYANGIAVSRRSYVNEDVVSL